MSEVKAPFTPEQVESINGFQASGFMHEFTCPFSDDHSNGRALVATTAGLECPSCDYQQWWVHSFMADGSWREHAAALSAWREGGAS